MQLPNIDELLAFRNSLEWVFESNTDKGSYKNFKAEIELDMLTLSIYIVFICKFRFSAYSI